MTLNTGLTGVGFEAALLQVARRLGTVSPTRGRDQLIDHLRPYEAATAHPRSLSALHGTGAFPWHCDGAHRVVPPHYLVFGAVQISGAHEEFHVLDVAKCAALNSPEAIVTTFLVRNGRNSFYSSVADESRSFVRHDPGCMIPMDENGAALQSQIEASSPSTTITWREGMICLLDNWRFLHRRSIVANRTDRHIMRVSVRGNP